MYTRLIHTKYQNQEFQLQISFRIIHSFHQQSVACFVFLLAHMFEYSCIKIDI